MKLYGFYFVKDEFYALADYPYLKDNKDGKRPFYYCFKEEFETRHIYWLIPLTSRIEKYIDREYMLNGNHLILRKTEYINAIESKARTIKTLISQGVRFNPISPNTDKILQKLLND